MKALNSDEKALVRDMLHHIGDAKISGGFMREKYRAFWLGAAAGVNYRGYGNGKVSLVLMDRFNDLIHKMLAEDRPLRVIEMAEWDINYSSMAYSEHCVCKGDHAIECDYCDIPF